MTARLLRLCAAGLSEPRSVSEAIARVGARPLAETITSLSVMRVFIPTTLGQCTLWIHAIGTALTARCIAQIASPSWQIPPEHVTSMVREHHMYDRERSLGRKGDLARLVRVLQSADAVNILMLTKPEYLNATDSAKAILLKRLYQGVGWSETETPCRADALAPELRRIDQECQRLAVFLGLAAHERPQDELSE